MLARLAAALLVEKIGPTGDWADKECEQPIGLKNKRKKEVKAGARRTKKGGGHRQNRSHRLWVGSDSRP
jgi:hypothetical protein